MHTLPEAGLITGWDRARDYGHPPSPCLKVYSCVGRITESQAERNLKISFLVSICFADEEIQRWEGPFLWSQS